MNQKVSAKIISLSFGVLVITFVIVFYAVAWAEPTEAPPGGNIDTSINVGTDPQAKAGRLSATEFYDYNDPAYYINPSGDSKLNSLTVIGGTLLPACDFSYRGKMFLLQNSSGTKDGLYVCRKKSNDSYGWATFVEEAALTVARDHDKDGWVATGYATFGIEEQVPDDVVGGRNYYLVGGYYNVEWSQKLGEGDCYDANIDVKPGQTSYFSVHRGDGSFDYNCDSAQSKLYGCPSTLPGASCTAIRPTSGAGFAGTQPACGAAGTFRTCDAWGSYGCNSNVSWGPYTCGFTCPTSGCGDPEDPDCRSWNTKDIARTEQCR